jgi:hypothetical protein
MIERPSLRWDCSGAPLPRRKKKGDIRREMGEKRERKGREKGEKKERKRRGKGVREKKKGEERDKRLFPRSNLPPTFVKSQ